MKCLRFVSVILIFTLLVGVSHAKDPWGISRKVPEETTFGVYAIDNLLDNRSIRYALSEEITPEEEQIFKENMLKWPAETLRFIKESGRSREFKDIIPILERRLVFERVPLSTSPDIALFLSTELKNYVNGDFEPKKDGHPFNEIRINKNYRNEFSPILLHELGHYFGLGDQYTSARWANAHEEYSSNVNETDGAVMNEELKITCDDADGFINLMDLRLAQRQNGQFSARAQKGWRSLCHNSNNKYKKAKTINRNRQDPYIQDLDDLLVLNGREYSRGNLTRKTHSFLESPLQLFAITPSDTVKRDRKTKRVTSIRSVLQARIDNDQEEKEVPLTWERTFAYPSVSGTPGQRTVSIRVTEYINKAPLPSYTINIHEDGSISGNIGGFLTSTGYRAKMVNYTISLELQNRHTKTFFLEEQFDEDLISLAGNLQHRFVRLFQKTGPGQSAQDYKLLVQCPLPLNDDCDWRVSYLLETFKIHQNHLTSFYKNFYEPLFNNTPQQTREQVQNSIRSRH